MTAQHPKPSRFTVEQFLAWIAEQPEGRYELVAGEIVAMAPENTGHARAKLATVNALAATVAAKRLPCEAMIDGVGVRVDDHTLYIPDVFVRCVPEPQRRDGGRRSGYRGRDPLAIDPRRR